jgi:hypothetical protein
VGGPDIRDSARSGGGGFRLGGVSVHAVGGKQLFALSESNEDARRAAVFETRSIQLRAFDTGIFLQFLQALNAGDQRLADFLYQRFRPEMKPAADAWLATRPLSNPSAPRSPFVMEEYRLRADDEAKRFDRLRVQKLDAAQAANENSDRYVLMTVPFAIVSLFAGLSTKFGTRIRPAILALASAVFAAAAIALSLLPRAA